MKYFALVAKQAVDYILSNEADMPEEAVVWDFIGGEPFLEIDIIDKLCDYIKIEMYRRNHRWFDNYRFSFSTNVLLPTWARPLRFFRTGGIACSLNISGKRARTAVGK